MDGARDELLAGAGLAGDEHRALGLGHELRALDHVFHRAAAPDDAVVVELLVALADEVAVLGAQPLMLSARCDDQPGHAIATLDVVVTAVEVGHGKRRNLLSDYSSRSVVAKTMASF